ncbi:MAG: hypothetical protein U1F87_12155 [Kiritimatiellia bacterium]
MKTSRPVWPPPWAGFRPGKTARGDHVEIRQAATGQPGAGLTFPPSPNRCSASELTLSARPSFPTFLESDQHAREELEISGTPTAGGTVRAVVTLAAGLKVTNTVTAVSGSTAGSLMTALAGLINGSPAP